MEDAVPEFSEFWDFWAPATFADIPFDEHLHPRDRKGRWRDVLFDLDAARKARASLDGDGGVAKPPPPLDAMVSAAAAVLADNGAQTRPATVHDSPDARARTIRNWLVMNRLHGSGTTDAAQDNRYEDRLTAERMMSRNLSDRLTHVPTTALQDILTMISRRNPPQQWGVPVPTNDDSLEPEAFQGGSSIVVRQLRLDDPHDPRNAGRHLVFDYRTNSLWMPRHGWDPPEQGPQAAMHAVALGTPEADTMLRDAMLAEIVGWWNSTSNDSHIGSLAVQDAAASWNADAESEDWFTGPVLGEKVGDLVEAYGDVLSQLLNEQYNLTQEFLSALGVERLPIFRGMVIDNHNIERAFVDHERIADELLNAGPGDGKQHIATDGVLRQRPLSSWTTDLATAIDFAGQDQNDMVAAPFLVGGGYDPAYIFSTPLTGAGEYSEMEIVTTPDADLTATVVRVFPTWEISDDPEEWSMWADEIQEALGEDFVNNVLPQVEGGVQGVDVNVDTDERNSDWLHHPSPVEEVSLSAADLAAIDGRHDPASPPEGWTARPIGTGMSNPHIWTETATGHRIVVKGPRMGGRAEVAAEAVASHILRGAGFPQTPHAAANPQHRLAAMTYAGDAYPGTLREPYNMDRISSAEDFSAMLTELSDPLDLLRIVVTDAALHHDDRHLGNYMVGTASDGRPSIIPVDHGDTLQGTYDAPESFDGSGDPVYPTENYTPPDYVAYNTAGSMVVVAHALKEQYRRLLEQHGGDGTAAMTAFEHMVLDVVRDQIARLGSVGRPDGSDALEQQLWDVFAKNLAAVAQFSGPLAEQFIGWMDTVGEDALRETFEQVVR